jgi:hypothetical protein
LRTPVRAIAATPGGLGYYLLESSGTVHAFGDAVFLGDGHAATNLTGSVVASAAGNSLFQSAAASSAGRPPKQVEQAIARDRHLRGNR